MAVSEIEVPAYPEEILRFTDGRRILGMDWDDNVAPFDKPFREFLKSTKGIVLENPKAGAFAYHLAYPESGITHEEFVAFIAEFSNGPAVEMMEPFPGAVEAIAALSERYDVQIITARPADQRGATARLINKHIGEYVNWLHMPNKGENHLDADKGTLCRLLGAAAMVDDADHNTNMVIRATKGQTKGILHKNDAHTHNGHELHEEAIVVPSLSAVVAIDDYRTEEGRWPNQSEIDELLKAA